MSNDRKNIMMDDVSNMTDETVWSSSATATAKAREKRARSVFSPLLLLAYRMRRCRRVCISLCVKLESGRFYSRTLRDILRRFHGVEIGHYSYGAILTPGVLPTGTKVGNYCSVGMDLIVRRRNHPSDRVTQHPFFYNGNLGYVAEDTVGRIKDNPLNIGHDVWIGDRVTILPGCRTIGNGAVIGAGAVVTRDVPPYAVVAGIPAKIIKNRFSEQISLALEESRWWSLPLAALLDHKELLLVSMTPELANHFSNKFADTRTEDGG